MHLERAYCVWSILWLYIAVYFSTIEFAMPMADLSHQRADSTVSAEVFRMQVRVL